jgi:MtN3 and saliva related transmembrane protein
MTLVTILGFMAATLTTVCWLPQAWKTIRSGDTRAISISAQALYATGLAMWALYGAAIASLPLLAANVVSLLPVAAILAIKVRNHRDDERAAIAARSARSEPAAAQ